MKYFIDAEFHEDGKTIDLISLAVVREDGKEFYQFNSDCNLRKAMRHAWLRTNVLLPIYEELTPLRRRRENPFSRAGMRKLFNAYGVTKPTIATELMNFTGFETEWGEWAKPNDPPVFYGYYSAYDWVVLCQLFGRMIDLPEGFPMFCMDLRQMMEERGLTKEWKREHCPDPEGEHNALVDARWNKALYEKIIHYSILKTEHTTMKYDSTPDTQKHIDRVADLLNAFAAILKQRGRVHDASKLEDPEKALFDEYTPKLKDCTYGSPEYKQFLVDLKPALDHHYAHNSHHPEHYPNGVNGMDLFDLVEMFLDWKAATERTANGDIRKSIDINKARFGLSEQLVDILRNTAETLFPPRS